jgi:GMP synthase (glutamine-hydrolysing)
MRVLAIVHQRDAGPGVFADTSRDRGVELEQWLSAEAPAPSRDPRSYDAVLVLGGAMNVDQEERHRWLRPEKDLLRDLLERRVPVLGVCLGAQLVAEAAGAAPRRAREPEIGWREVELTPDAADDPVLAGLPDRFEAFQWHSYEFPLPPDARPLARSPGCLQAFRLDDFAWGIQFHAEVTRAIVEDWIDDYRSDEDAVRIGIDDEALRLETRRSIATWNELGSALWDRFLTAAGAAVQERPATQA